MSRFPYRAALLVVYLAVAASGFASVTALATSGDPLQFRFSTYTENGWDCILFQPRSGAVKPITAVCR